jgi:hypothetical protein
MCLHLARLQLPASGLGPALDVRSPLPADLSVLLEIHAPEVLAASRAALADEAGLTGLLLAPR